MEGMPKPCPVVATASVLSARGGVATPGTTTASLPARVGDSLNLHRTFTRSSIKHTALGTFKQVRMHDKVDGLRLRASTVCLRRVAGEWQVCLINCVNPSKAGVWKMPGGGVEVGETPAETAVRETLEEAGLKGRIAASLGVFKNPAKKTKTQWFVLLVSEQLTEWDEGTLGRRRKWFPVHDALNVLETPYHCRLLRDAVATMSSDSDDDAKVAQHPHQQPQSLPLLQQQRHRQPSPRRACEAKAHADAPQRIPLSATPSPRVAVSPSSGTPVAAAPVPIPSPEAAPATATPTSASAAPAAMPGC